jgi:2,3-bisphosphoglycerate-independent phosphoglycerate mutase
MNQSRKDVLDLLKEGKITAEEAEMLLDALSSERPKAQDAVVFPKKTGRKMLFVLIKSKKGDVKIQVPIEFAKFMKFAKLDPKLQEQNIDFEELIKLVEDGIEGELVNMSTADGDIVRIVVQ